MKRLLYILLPLLLMACEQNEPQMALEAVEFPIQLAVPALSSSTRQAAPADPGTQEVLPIPEHIYLYWVIEDSLGNVAVQQILDTLLPAERWTRTTNPTAAQQATDEVYLWKGNLIRMLPKNWAVVHLYAAAAPTELSLSNPNPTTRDQVCGQQFAVTDELQPLLRDVYATPYNYTISGRYYGTLTGERRAQQATLLLYHVAAKVDLNWTVQEDQRKQMRLTSMQAAGLFQGNAYLFRHTENTLAAIPTGGYTHTLIKADDVGLQWSGRAYFYTIPYTVADRFPLLLVCQQNDIETDYTLTLRKDMRTAHEVFTPWMRGNLNFTQPLTEDRSLDVE